MTDKSIKKDKGIPLSRLLITGNVNQYTPLIVIKEILYIHRIRNISQLNNSRVKVISENIEKKDIKDVSFFINPFEKKWDEDSLLKAWKYLKSFMGSNIIRKWDISEIGLQSSRNPFSLNVCMLYRLCRQWNIPTTKRMTPEEMVGCIQVALIAPKCIRNIICLNINDELDSYNNRNSPESFERLNQLYHNRPNEPGNNFEAVCISAIEHNTDISYSPQPLIDYYHKMVMGNYYTETMKEIVEKNKDIIDMSKTFNPIFPHEYYSKTISILANKIGISSIYILEKYDLLLLGYSTNNFYKGWQLKMLREDSPISMDEISEDYDVIICYGNYIDGFTPLTVNDIIGVFQYTKNFVNPLNYNEHLSDQMIITLEKIAQEYYPELSSVMRLIKLNNIKCDNQTMLFIKWYKTSLDNSQRQYVYDLLRKILDLAMCMRGWKMRKNEPYPIKRIPCDIEEVISLTTLAIWPVLDSYSSEEGKRVLTLPLYKFSRISDKWIRSTDRDEGLTILERINIVKNGEEHISITSCIKMSSNWIAMSAYKYITVLGYPEPFDIYQFETIST